MSESDLEQKPMWQISYTIACALVFLLALASHQILKLKLYVLPTEVFWIETGLGAVLVMLMIVSMIKKKSSTMWWEVMLLVIALAGVWVLAISLMPIWAGVMVASFVTLVAFFWKNTLSSNLFYIFGALGIGLLAAWHFSSLVMIILALGVLLYDASRSKEMGMATLYFEARKSGLVPSILIPIDIGGWFKNRKDVWRPGKGQVVGILPFMALAGLCFHTLLRFSAVHFLILGIFVIVVGLSWGIDQKFKLKPWVFLISMIAAFTAIYIINLL
ncbi:hypothetical protein GF391_01280 [Candidatus Uhrbacteria bacterium]|nr:hypothetical protein [Candidatus Uhrbacteria bacterium]